MRAGEEFRPILKARARGPAHLGSLEPKLCEEAMELILSGKATPAQIGGFLLVGRAYGDSAEELAAYARVVRSFARKIDVPGPPIVTVTGGFDGKLRTLNIGATASLVAAAAGGRTLMLGCEGTPPKAGRTVFDALRGLLIPSPHNLQEAKLSLTEHSFAAISADQYLPELYALLGLRWEIVRRTALNVVEKLVSPIPGSRLLVGITHRPFLESIPAALMDLGVTHALVFQAIEGSDEASLDGSSTLVRICGDKVEELRIPPESLGLTRATKAHIPWRGKEDEAHCLLGALAGEEGAVHDLILYNAALRLWVADWNTPLKDHLEITRAVLSSGRTLELIDRLCGRVPASR